MEFVERYDLQKVQYLESLGFTEIKPYLGKCKNDDDRRIMYERIQRMCFGIIRNRGMVLRQYHYSYTTPLESGGRLFCGNSIQGMSKSIRGFLVGNITTDIDIVNAHPVILRFLCKKHNIHCAELDNYVLNRAQVLRQFPDRNKTKKLFLTSVNSDKVIRNNSIILKRFDNEMKDIQKILTGLPEYADIKDSVPDDKKSDNWNGSSINRILCMMENKILRVAITVCNANGVEVFAPMFDGLLVYGSATDDLLRKIETAVESEFPGLGAEWAFKAHETDISIPEGWSPVKPDDNVKIANDDAEAASMVYDTIKDRLVYSEKNYYFKTTNNVWSSDEHEITRMVRFIVLNSGICRKDSKGETVSYTQNLRNATSITTCIFDIAVNRADDGWVGRVFKSSHGYVLFKNGYWSFKANKFFRNGCDDFNSKIIFMDSIPFDYDESFNDEARITYVNDTLFRMPFGDEVGEYYKLNIARGLAGDCMKRFLVGIGPRNTGKSTISLALKESCGGYYAGWNGAGIAVKNNITDEAQRLRWLLLLRNKRIIVSNELSTNINIDGNMFKKMSNGGADDIVARMHQGYETDFHVGFLPILFAQDLPTITPYDDAVEGRLRAIPYTKEYVNEPTSELHLRMNPDLHSDIATGSFRQAFLRLLFRSYYSFHSNGRVESAPAIIYENTKEVVGCEANVVDTWLCNYEITNNPDDYVLSSDIQKWLDEERLGITIKKFTMELKRYCLLKGIANVMSKDKKIQGRCVKVWSGCRVPPADDDCLI